eukprot:g13491.t1
MFTLGLGATRRTTSSSTTTSAITKKTPGAAHLAKEDVVVIGKKMLNCRERLFSLGNGLPTRLFSLRVG